MKDYTGIIRILTIKIKHMLLSLALLSYSTTISIGATFTPLRKHQSGHSIGFHVHTCIHLSAHYSRASP